MIDEYAKQLLVFQGQGATNAQQMAWMTANLIVGKDPTRGVPVSPSALTLQACAIDKDRYYYIPFEYDRPGPDQELSLPIPRQDTAIYWVDEPNWNQTPEDWKKNLIPADKKGLGLAEKARKLP